MAHHGNVKEERFGVPFIKRFSVVLNGLDNMDARRHVNRLCLAAEVPLVESGTNGFLGQVTPHVRGRTECFECQTKPAPKTYPVCTIRNTPDKPVHCVVWAKEMLFARLFGDPKALSELDEEDSKQETEASGAGEGGEVDGEVKKGEQDLSFFLRNEGEVALDYARRIFARVYGADVRRLVAMEDLWKKGGRKPPSPLENSLTAGAPPALGGGNPHATLSTAESAGVFVAACAALVDSCAELGELAFDKEQDVMVDFVAAAANLRMACFGIPQQSKFDIKGIAGNIVHAVATTNAMVSGLLVLEAIKLLTGRLDDLKATFVREFPTTAGGRATIITPTAPPPAKSSCFVCGRGQLRLTIDTEVTTLQMLLDAVVRKRMGFNAPTIGHQMWYEPEEDVEEDQLPVIAKNLTLSLAQLGGGGIKDGSVVNITDDSQGSASVDVVVTHQSEWDEEKHPQRFILEGQMPAENGAANKGGANEATDEADESSDDDMVMFDGPPPEEDDKGKALAAAAGSKKRPRDADEGGEAGERQTAKRQELRELFK